MSQETVDQKLREWNETWFGSNKSIEAQKDDDIPDFLKKKFKIRCNTQSLQCIS